MGSLQFIFATLFLLSVTHLFGCASGQASEGAQSCKPVETKLANCERSAEALRAEVSACGVEKTAVRQQHDELVNDCNTATKKWEVALEETKKQKAAADANVVNLESKMAAVDTSCKSVETEKSALAAKAEALAQQLKELETKRLQIDSEFKNLQNSCADISKQAKEKDAMIETQLVSVTDKLKSEMAHNAELAGENSKNQAEKEVLTARISALIQEQQQSEERVKDLAEYQYLFSVVQAKRLFSGMYTLTKTSYKIATATLIANTPNEVKDATLRHWSTLRGCVTDVWAKHFTPNYVVMKRQLSSSGMVTTSTSAFYDHVWPLMETHGVTSYSSKLWEKTADFQEDFTNVALQLSIQVNRHIDDLIVSKVTAAAPQVGSMIPPNLLDRLSLLVAWVCFTVIQKKLLMKALCFSMCLLKTIGWGLACALTCGKCTRRDGHKRRQLKGKPKTKTAVHKHGSTKAEALKVMPKADNNKDVKRVPMKK